MGSRRDCNRFDGGVDRFDDPKPLLRRARGMRDEQMLLLKLKWTTAHPIRSDRDLARFLSTQGTYSNQ